MTAKSIITLTWLVLIGTSVALTKAAPQKNNAALDRSASPTKSSKGTPVVKETARPPAEPPTSTAEPASAVLNPMTGEQIRWQVIGGGGGRSTSTNYALSGTAGQTAVGTVSSTNYRVIQGFWQDFSISTGCCLGVVGNADGDAGDAVDISDLQVYIDYLFFSGTAASCLVEFDAAGGDGVVDISDLQVIVDYLFFGGSLPVCP